MVKYSCLVMVELGGEPSNLTGGGGYRRRRRGWPLGWPMYNWFYVILIRFAKIQKVILGFIAFHCFFIAYIWRNNRDVIGLLT